MRYQLVLTVLAAFLLGALAALLMRSSTAPERSASQVEVTGKALIGGPFRLVDHTGKTVTHEDYRGKFMLVFFGYTFCPDICPTELQAMAAALGKLGKSAERIVPLFITIDPQRDTPAQMASYVKNFHPRLAGLTGPEEDIRAAAKAYRIYYAKVENKNSPADYLMDHSSFVYLMSPDGEYVTHFPYGISAEKMAEGLKKRL